MKKDMRSFWWSLGNFIVSSLGITGTILGWWEVREPIILIMCLHFVQLVGIFGLGVSIKKRDRNYKSKEIKEENFFKIISMESNFDRPAQKEKYGSDYMHVDLHNFGETMILFPLNKHNWIDGYPKPGQVWIKRRNFFVLALKKEEPC